MARPREQSQELQTAPPAGLPVELWGTIAQELAAGDQFKSCAALNATNKAIWLETLSTLFKIVVVKNETTARQRYLQWASVVQHEVAERVRYLAVYSAPFQQPHESQEFDNAAKLFTGLRAYIGTFFLSSGVGLPVPFVAIGLRETYRFGGNDLYYLSRALRLFGFNDAGLLERPIAVRMGERRSGEAGTVETKRELSKTIRRLESNATCRLEFQPRRVFIDAGGLKNFIELVYWVTSREDLAADYSLPDVTLRAESFDNLQGYTRAVGVDNMNRNLHADWDREGYQPLVWTVGREENGETLDTCLWNGERKVVLHSDKDN